MSTLPLIHIPCLHPGLAEQPVQVLDGEGPVMSLWPGLPDPAPDQHWYIPAYPYTPAEARTCLTDWKALVSDKGTAGGFVPDEAALGAILGRPHEARDLQNFVHTGTHKSAACAAGPSAGCATGHTGGGATGHTGGCATLPVPDRASLCEAQRRLLMIWMQEDEVMAIRSLLADYRHGMRQLSAALGERDQLQSAEAAPDLPHEVELLAELAEAEASDDLPPTEDTGFLPDDTGSLLPAWTFVLDAMAPFLPPDAVLCTADGRVAMALDAWGVERVRLIPATATAQAVSVARLPLWQLAGKHGPAEDAPWLNRLCELRVVEA